MFGREAGTIVATGSATPGTGVPAEAAQAIVPGSVESWVVASVQSLGPHAELLTFVGAILENTALVSVALPGGIAVVVAAAAGRATGASLPLMFVLATIGTIVGATFDWALGRVGISRVLAHRASGRAGTYLLRKLTDAEPTLERHGWWVMLLTHVIGQGRTVLAVASGASGMPLRRFLIIETPAATLWSAIYVSGGYWLGGRMHEVVQLLVRWGWLAIAIIAAGAGVTWVVRLVLARRPAPAGAA